MKKIKQTDVAIFLVFLYFYPEERSERRRVEKERENTEASINCKTHQQSRCKPALNSMLYNNIIYT